MRMLELYHNFSTKFCDNDKYEEKETHTHSLYLVLAKKYCMFVYKARESKSGNCYAAKIVMTRSLQTLAANFPSNFCAKHKKQDKRELGLFKEEFRYTEILCLCSKTYCCYNFVSIKFHSGSKGLKKGTLEDSGVRAMKKYRKALGQTENVTSATRGFRTKKHCVATYVQTKKGISYFYPKRIVESVGIHTFPLKL